MNRTLRSCLRCGKIFYGGSDQRLCEECAKESRRENVVRTRICVDCGRSFNGGPRARRCQECRKEAERNNGRIKKSSPTRPLGSLDTCLRCGNPYVVNSGRQKYCPGCQRAAVLQWQRDHKKEYSGRLEVSEARRRRREERRKICAYCLRSFWDGSTSNCCSVYCRKQHQRIKSYQAGIKRGSKRNLKGLEEERERYRENVKRNG